MINKRFFDTLYAPGIYGIFGKPRAGKSTLAAAVVSENNRRRDKYNSIHSSFIKRLYFRYRPFFDYVYSTDESVSGCIYCDADKLGNWCPKDNSLIIIEEAGCNFSDRDWKKSGKLFKRLCAYIGHHKSTILFLSQSVDVDKVMRVRAAKMWIVSRFIRHLSFIKTVTYECGVDNEKGELRDMYHIAEGFLENLLAVLRHQTFLFNRKPYYKCFNSYEDTYNYPEIPPDGVD